MHFLVLSDSHGHPEKINRVLERAGRVDGVFFLGDGLRDLHYCDIQNLYCIEGNWDNYSRITDDYPSERVLTLCNKKIFMTHGHKYDVKYSLDSLIYAAAEKDADIVLFGHTHKPLEMRLTPDTCKTLNKPLYLLNPGSIGDWHASWGCLDITNRGEILLCTDDLYDSHEDDE